MCMTQIAPSMHEVRGNNSEQPIPNKQPCTGAGVPVVVFVSGAPAAKKSQVVSALVGAHWWVP